LGVAGLGVGTKAGGIERGSLTLTLTLTRLAHLLLALGDLTLEPRLELVLRELELQLSRHARLALVLELLLELLPVLIRLGELRIT
jgi:hypothetical protein